MSDDTLDRLVRFMRDRACIGCPLECNEDLCDGYDDETTVEDMDAACSDRIGTALRRLEDGDE